MGLIVPCWAIEFTVFRGQVVQTYSFTNHNTAESVFSDLDGPSWRAACGKEGRLRALILLLEDAMFTFHLACVGVWNSYEGLPQPYRERDCLMRSDGVRQWQLQEVCPLSL